jgi:hypothetical protein
VHISPSYIGDVRYQQHHHAPGAHPLDLTHVKKAQKQPPDAERPDPSPPPQNQVHSVDPVAGIKQNTGNQEAGMYQQQQEEHPCPLVHENQQPDPQRPTPQVHQETEAILPDKQKEGPEEVEKRGEVGVEVGAGAVADEQVHVQQPQQMTKQKECHQDQTTDRHPGRRPSFGMFYPNYHGHAWSKTVMARNMEADPQWQPKQDPQQAIAATAPPTQQNWTRQHPAVS